MWNNSDISVTNEKCTVLEWLSPHKPGKRHQAIGMGRVDGVGDWLLHTNKFTQWSKSDDGTAKPRLFWYGGSWCLKAKLMYRSLLLLKSAREAK